MVVKEEQSGAQDERGTHAAGEIEAQRAESALPRLTVDLLLAKPPLEVLEATAEELPDLRFELVDTQALLDAAALLAAALDATADVWRSDARAAGAAAERCREAVAGIASDLRAAIGALNSVLRSPGS